MQIDSALFHGETEKQQVYLLNPSGQNHHDYYSYSPAFFAGKPGEP